MWEKGFQQKQTVKDVDFSTKPKGRNLYIKKVLSFLLYIPFPWQET